MLVDGQICNPEGVDVYNLDAYTGKAEFDYAFDLSTPEAQQAVLDTCAAARTLKCDLPGCDNQGYGTMKMKSPSSTLSCFLEDFKNFSCLFAV